MKKLYPIVLVLIFLSGKIYSQNIQWATIENGPYADKNMVSGPDSTIYIYSHFHIADADPYSQSFSDILTYKGGSFVEQFSPQGNLVFYKSWAAGHAFFIQKIIYDGNQDFYFSGFFAGNFTVDGITLNSRGGTDGMVGKMNSSGTILWISTFGGIGHDLAQGICFNTSKSSLVITGSINDSLIVNNAYSDKGEQSILVAKFSLGGIFQSHKLYDFLPQRDNMNGTQEGLGNCGKQIVADFSGNYFILTTREGKHPWCCPFDTLNAPEEGVYIIKLNNSLDTLWSKFIIGPSCYYGWSYGNLEVATNGDPYINAYCNSHYGGTGFVERLNQNTGAVSWSEHYNDGGFTRIFLEGSNLYTCGTDSVKYYPSQYSGYQSIKKLDSANSLQQIIRFNGPVNYNNQLNFRNILRDGFGNTYIYGIFWSPCAIFGNDTLYHSGGANGGYYWGGFVLKLSDAVITSIEESLFKEQFTVYPNPSTGIVEIHTDHLNSEKLSYRAINGMGRVIYKNTLFNKSSIDLSREPKGIYVIEISNGKDKKYSKVVVE